MEGVQDGAVILNLLIAAVLTLVIGVGALGLRQRSILRHMAATRGTPGGAAPDPERPRRTPTASLILAAEDPAVAASASPLTSRALFRVALSHAVAGLTFATIAALL